MPFNQDKHRSDLISELMKELSCTDNTEMSGKTNLALNGYLDDWLRLREESRQRQNKTASYNIEDLIEVNNSCLPTIRTAVPYLGTSVGSKHIETQTIINIIDEEEEASSSGTKRIVAASRPTGDQSSVAGVKRKAIKIPPILGQTVDVDERLKEIFNSVGPEMKRKKRKLVDDLSVNSPSTLERVKKLFEEYWVTEQAELERTGINVNYIRCRKSKQFAKFVSTFKDEAFDTLKSLVLDFTPPDED